MEAREVRLERVPPLPTGTAVTETSLLPKTATGAPVWPSLTSKQGHCYCLVVKSHPTLCDPRDCSPPGSSVHGILQARILKWVAISFSMKRHINSIFIAALFTITEIENLSVYQRIS